jgi:hypothetical protein
MHDVEVAPNTSITSTARTAIRPPTTGRRRMSITALNQSIGCFSVTSWAKMASVMVTSEVLGGKEKIPRLV